MQWLLILALWNTNPPQDSFKFFTKPYENWADCQAELEQVYAASFNKGVQAQAVCVSKDDLGLTTY